MARNKFSIIFIIAIAFILASLLITSFIYKERKRQDEMIVYQLSNITERDAAIVHNLFYDYIDTLCAIAIHINSAEDLTSSETIEFLRKMSESFGFERISIDFPDGKSYTSDGIESISDEFIKYTESDHIFITDVIASNIDGEPMVYIQVPIRKNGLTIASLGLSLKREDLNNRLKTVLSEENKYFYIIDEYGEYVAFDAGENTFFSADVNFFDSLDTFTYEKGFSKELIEKAFIDGKSGHTEYSFKGISRHGYYSPVGINNWVMLSIMSKDVVDADINRFLTNAIILAVQILIIFLSVSGFVYLDQKKMRRITELNEQCFHILAEHTGKVVLEWDYAKKTTYYPKLMKVTGWEMAQLNLHSSDGLINGETIHPDDRDIFQKMFSELREGQSVNNSQLRIRTMDEVYRHFSISSILICDSDGKPYKALGFLENIDTQIRKENDLYRKASIDQLTELYNKVAAEEFISDIIQSSNLGMTHALLCVDIDNFKGINDGFGHLYGDMVLKELAENIKSLFRTSDILGRFGGDEFVIFVHDIPSIEFIIEKVGELNKCLNKTYHKDDSKCTVSASIGIAVFPSDGETYEMLYEKADEASYVAKRCGKNSYRFANKIISNQMKVIRQSYMFEMNSTITNE